MEELGFDKCLASDFEFWGWSLQGISGDLVPTLGFSYLQPELLV